MILHHQLRSVKSSFSSDLEGNCSDGEFIVSKAKIMVYIERVPQGKSSGLCGSTPVRGRGIVKMGSQQ